MKVFNVTEDILEFNWMELEYEECMQAATAFVDMFFKNEEYCKYKRFFVDIDTFCTKNDTDCDFNKAMSNF